jgi:hypothetical protein
MRKKLLLLIFLGAIIAGCARSVQPLDNRSKKTSYHRNPSVEKHKNPLPKKFLIKGTKKTNLGQEHK